jgi:hypothetical protein
MNELSSVDLCVVLDKLICMSDVLEVMKAILQYCGVND